VKGAISLDTLDKKAFYKELIGLAIPLGLQNLLTALIGATDALILGRLSQEAVAAVSLGNQIAFIMSMFTFSVIGGGGVLVAQYWGKGDRKTVKNLMCTIIKYSLGISVVFWLLASFAPEMLMRLYTPEQALIDIGSKYLKVVSVSYLLNAVNQGYFLIMKVSGNTTRSVVISVVTLVTDVVLDLLFVYGLFGLPRLGATGSALSTVFVEAVAFVWCVAFSFRKDMVRPDLKGFIWFNKDMFRDLMKVALPMLASALTWGVGFSMRSLLMGHMGTDATAASSIAALVQELVTCLCKGVSTGSGIMLGKLLGENMLPKAKAYGAEFWKVSIWVGLLNSTLVLLVSPLAVMFFVLTETARQYLIWMLLFSAVYVFAFSLNTIVTCGVFPAGGDSAYDAISVAYSMWCFALPASFLALFVLKWPVMVVYILMCADEIVKLPWIYPRYKKYIWLKNLTRDDV